MSGSDGIPRTSAEAGEGPFLEQGRKGSFSEDLVAALDRARRRRQEILENKSALFVIARVCHEANRAYCRCLGDNSQPEWDDAPKWQKESALAGVRLHLAFPTAGPERSHEAWMARKIREGWSHGPVKDPEKKQHPCLVPFRELSPGQQQKDILFCAIVHSFVEEI